MGWDLMVLQRGMSELGFPLTQAQLAQFDSYLNLLIEWNQRINLTAITDPVDIQSRLFLDSLYCIVATGDLSDQRVVDVGSGGGFPGLPLKIFFPHMRLTLLESVAKKARFLEEVCQVLTLHDVNIVVERAETIGQQTGYRSSCDWAMARAVAPLNILVEYLIPLCKVGGHALAPKGAKAKAEVDAAMSAIKLLGGGEAELLSMPSPDQHSNENSPAKTVLVIIKKIEKTPDKFPRRIGVPIKRPL